MVFSHNSGGLRQGGEEVERDLKISHPSFANDTLIFCEALSTFPYFTCQECLG